MLQWKNIQICLILKKWQAVTILSKSNILYIFLTSITTLISSSGMHTASLTCVTRALVSGVIESWKRDRNSLGLLSLNSSALATYCWISIKDCSASSGEDEHFSICCDANRSTPRAHHLFAWNKGEVCKIHTYCVSTEYFLSIAQQCTVSDFTR